jgi:hypothetical protein
MSEKAIADVDPEQQDAAPEIVARAEALVRKYPSSFWFRHPDAKIRSVEDVRIVIRRLRESGNRQAWDEAQDLVRCL